MVFRGNQKEPNRPGRSTRVSARESDAVERAGLLPQRAESKGQKKRRHLLKVSWTKPFVWKRSLKEMGGLLRLMEGLEKGGGVEKNNWGTTSSSFRGECGV